MLSFIFLIGAWSGFSKELLESPSIKQPMELFQREFKYRDLSYLTWGFNHEVSEFIILQIPAVVENLSSSVIIYNRISQDRSSIQKALALWNSLQGLRDLHRGRDLYWILSFPKDIASFDDVSDLVHHLIKAIPNHKQEWTTIQKIEAAQVWEQFPTLLRADLVFTSESDGNNLWAKPFRYIPLGMATRGRFRFKDKSASSLNLVTIEQLNQKKKLILRSMQGEWNDFSKSLNFLLPFWKRWLNIFCPRLLMRTFDLEYLSDSQWGIDSTNSIWVNFIGDREPNDLKQEYLKIQGREWNSELEVAEYIPFRRTFSRGSEYGIIREELERIPNAKVSEFIPLSFNSAAFFRWVQIPTFDFFPGVLDENKQFSESDIATASRTYGEILRKILK